MRDLAFLAGEAIEMLERCLAGKATPHAGTVAELRNRLTRITESRGD